MFGSYEVLRWSSSREFIWYGIVILEVKYQLGQF
jgi:hypothetical protein